MAWENPNVCYKFTMNFIYENRHHSIALELHQFIYDLIHVYSQWIVSLPDFIINLPVKTYSVQFNSMKFLHRFNTQYCVSNLFCEIHRWMITNTWYIQNIFYFQKIYFIRKTICIFSYCRKFLTQCLNSEDYFNSIDSIERKKLYSLRYSFETKQIAVEFIGFHFVMFAFSTDKMNYSDFSPCICTKSNGFTVVCAHQISNKSVWQTDYLCVNIWERAKAKYGLKWIVYAYCKSRVVTLFRVFFLLNQLTVSMFVTI